MKNMKSEASTIRSSRRNRPFDPEFEALLAEGYIEESSEGEELSELFAEASWEALQLVDPD